MIDNQPQAADLGEPVIPALTKAVSKKEKKDNKKKNEMTPEEKQMKDECDKLDLIEEEKEIEIKKKLETEGFFSRLTPYAKPVINTYIGIFVSII